MENTTTYSNVTLNLVNTSEEKPNSLSDILQRLAPGAIAIDRVISPIWYTIGFICNPIATRIWLSRKIRRKNSSAIYVGTLAIVHTIFLCLHIILDLHYAWDVRIFDSPVWCETFNIAIMVPQYFAPLLVMAFTIERYIAVNHPFQKERFCTVRRAVYVSFGLGFFSLGLSSLQASIWGYDANNDRCMYRLDPGRDLFKTVWTLLTELLIFLFVPVCILIFNILVIKEIRRLTSKGPLTLQHSTTNPGSPTSTITLLSVSFYCICTLLPASAVYSLQSLLPAGKMDISYSAMSEDPAWKRYLNYLVVRKVVEEICLSNYACYFFIYYITGQYFRNEVHGIFTCRHNSSTSRIHRMARKSLSTSRQSEYTIVSNYGKITIHKKASTAI